MTDWKLYFFHRSPPILRDILASVRGYQLRQWRYGPETEDLVVQAIERDQWSPNQWKQYQDNRLGLILHRAATQVPYYREQWMKRRRKGDRSSWEYLENWPILDKRPLRATPMAFVADDCDIRNMFHEHTSGTTGTSISLWWSKNTVRQWYALFEARWRRWYGVSLNTRWAILGGQLVTPIEQNSPPFWVWNSAFKQLYMSSYHLSQKSIPSYLDALVRYRIEYIYAYTSSAYALAQIVNELQRQDLQMKVVITNAEPVYAYQRTEIEHAFKCPMRETYGQSEIAVAAGECECGSLHLWPEIGILEILEDATPVQEGTSGEFVVTGLLNADMPLIRYRVGDRGSRAASLTSCACGRQLPRLSSIDGRNDDILVTPDGRQIGRLDPVFKQELPVIEAQIIQQAIDHIHVKVVPARNYTSDDGDSIVTRLAQRFGQQMRITVETVSVIPRTKAGKFRAVISNLSPEERARIS